MAWMMLILTAEFVVGVAACLMALSARRTIARQADKIDYQAGTIEMQIEHIDQLGKLIGDLNRERS